MQTDDDYNEARQVAKTLHAKRRQHVANVTLTSQQVGYAMLNGLTKEELVEKALVAYCAAAIPTVKRELYLKPPVAAGSPCG
jgi:hypothetical protein